MGERWTELRDELTRDAPDGIRFLRTALIDSGPFMEPLGRDIRPAGLHLLPDPHDAAIVALLQACALLERRRFPARMVRWGETCRNVERGEMELAVGNAATRVERLLHELACKGRPDLHDGGTLNDSLLALKSADLLPLLPHELERWDADRAEVQQELDRKGSSKSRGRRGRAVAILWNRRARALFAERGADRRYPRYFAMLELQALRNAHAHGLSRDGQGIDVPLNSWRRLLAFTALICVRAFARDALRPSPVPEVGATTISRSPPVPEPEPLLAHAQVVPEAKPLVAVARVIEPAPVPELHSAAPSASEPPNLDAPARGGLRKWMLVTAAATAAVIVGTVGANLMAPRPVATAPSEVVVVETPEPIAPTPAPTVARGFAGDPDVESEPPKEPGGQTKLCRTRRGEPLTGPLPPLKVEGMGRGLDSRKRARSVGDVGSLLVSQERLGAVVVLVATESQGRDSIQRRLERTACEFRPVLLADDALQGPEPVDSALIVAELDGADDPRLPRLLDLAAQGRQPRLLLSMAESANLALAGSSSVVTPQPFGCDGARHAIAGLLKVNGTEAGVRLASWGMDLSPEKAGQTCHVAPALRDLRGIGVVAAAIAGHRSPPEAHDGTWGSWVLAAMTGEDSGPGAPPSEIALTTSSVRSISGVNIPAGPRKRRKKCEAWASKLKRPLGDADLLAHLVGTEPGRGCLAWLISGSVQANVPIERAVEAVDRGLGTVRWRNDALNRAVGDRGHVRSARSVDEVLARLAGPEAESQ